MDLSLEKYNVRESTLRCLLAVGHALGMKSPTEEQQEAFGDIADQLEARVQEELESASKALVEPSEEPEPYEEVTPKNDNGLDVFLVHNVDNNDEVINVVVEGVVYGKFCNEPVWHDPDDIDNMKTHCIKQFGHKHPDHEDSEGNTR